MGAAVCKKRETENWEQNINKKNVIKSQNLGVTAGASGVWAQRVRPEGAARRCGQKMRPGRMAVGASGNCGAGHGNLPGHG